MSRNTEHQFIPTDTGEVVALLTAIYEKITKTTVHPASPERLFIQYMANIIIQERVLNNYTGNQNVPSRAEGENLDALAELTHIKGRPEAKPAVCSVRFSISEAQDTAILIPAGTRVTDPANTLIWETEADAYVPIGETSVELSVRCQTAGTVGNGYAAGQINTLVDVYDYYSECVSTTESGGGSNVPDDDEYYELMRASMDSFSCAGARGGYIYWAKQVSTEIVDVMANSPLPGEVKIYVLMEGGTLAGEEMKNKVLAACSEDTKRPLTDHVCVEDAEVVPFDINFTYYLQTGRTKSAAEVAAAVNEAVEQYKEWQCAKLGRDINPDELREYLYHTGIKRIELISPTFTALRDGRDKKVPQVARVGTITITNGGYEDE
mgnify:FL=1